MSTRQRHTPNRSRTVVQQPQASMERLGCGDFSGGCGSFMGYIALDSAARGVHLISASRRSRPKILFRHLLLSQSIVIPIFSEMQCAYAITTICFCAFVRMII